MSDKNLCVYCGGRKGKRPCPALKGLICTACCGAHRHKEISCPECPHLAHEMYQVTRREERDLAEAMHAVNPDVCGRDALAASDDASAFAWSLESAFGAYFREFGIRDSDVLDALKAVYYRVYRDEPCSVSSEFADVLVRFLREKLMPEFLYKVPTSLQEGIVLRLMLSVKSMSGGPFGDCGYLNYVKNNILDHHPEGKVMVEFRDGTKRLMRVP